MDKQKVISKGFTLSVTSWENDGDNYATEQLTFESKDLSIAVARLCRDLFKSKNNSATKGIGNSGNSNSVHNVIVDYMKAHPELYELIENPSESDLVEVCMNYNYRLMGSSEYYYSRVFESASLTYSPEDIYLQTIQF